MAACCPDPLERLARVAAGCPGQRWRGRAPDGKAGDAGFAPSGWRQPGRSAGLVVGDRCPLGAASGEQRQQTLTFALPADPHPPPGLCRRNASTDITGRWVAGVDWFSGLHYHLRSVLLLIPSGLRFFKEPALLPLQLCCCRSKLCNYWPGRFDPSAESRPRRLQG